MQMLYQFEYTIEHGELTLASVHDHCTQELSVLSQSFDDEINLSPFMDLYGVKVFCNSTLAQIPADKPVKVRGYWVLDSDGNKLLPERLPTRNNYILG